MEKLGGYGLEEIHKNTRRSEQKAIDTTATKSTGFAEPLSEQVCDNVVESVTKSCFQSVNEIQKLIGHELEEIHINNPPESAENHLFWQWREFCVRAENLLFHLC